MPKRILLGAIVAFAASCAWFKLSLARDVPFVPTPVLIVDAMLETAEVSPGDVVYDLGSGDGRIVITAAKKFGAHGVGVEIDPELVAEARKNAEAAEVSERVEFIEGNLFDVDLSEATVVTLYLLQDLNVRLRPKLLRELKSGTRIVSYSFDMGDWEPKKTVQVNERKVYYWVVPENARR